MRSQSGFAPLRGNDFPKPLQNNVWSKIIMAFLRRQPVTGMAKFKFSRRELPGKLFAIAGVLLLPKPQPETLVIPIEVQPKFKIGDLVAEDWVNDDDEVNTEFGQVLGMAYFKTAQSCFPANSWVYYVNWTSSTSGADFDYPTYDQEASRESDLRLLSAEEICKQ
jgi:hypothetical protein